VFIVVLWYRCHISHFKFFQVLLQSEATAGVYALPSNQILLIYPAELMYFVLGCISFEEFLEGARKDPTIFKILQCQE